MYGKPVLLRKAEENIEITLQHVKNNHFRTRFASSDVITTVNRGRVSDSEALEVEPARDRNSAKRRRRVALSGNERHAVLAVRPLAEYPRLESAQPEQRAVAHERILAQVQILELRMLAAAAENAAVDRLDAVVGDVEMSQRLDVGDLVRHLRQEVAVQREMLQMRQEERSHRQEGEPIVAEVENLDAADVSKDVVFDAL